MEEKIKPRYHLIDSLRGFALINMVLFHLMYDVFMIYSSNRRWAGHPLTKAWELFICCSFILISGISFNFSKSPIKRGLVLMTIGVGITLVTAIFMPSELILFGVIFFIGAAMTACGLLKNQLKKISPSLGLATSLVLFALSYSVPAGYVGFFSVKLFKLPEELYSFRLLAGLGFPPEKFFSTDYFPVIPWIFLFAAGCFLWRIISKSRFEQIFKFKIPVLNTIGRHTLIIYIVHQPIIMAALSAAYALFSS